jgi:hypothetical protein
MLRASAAEATQSTTHCQSLYVCIPVDGLELIHLHSLHCLVDGEVAPSPSTTAAHRRPCPPSPASLHWQWATCIPSIPCRSSLMASSSIPCRCSSTASGTEASACARENDFPLGMKQSTAWRAWPWAAGEDLIKAGLARVWHISFFIHASTSASTAAATHAPRLRRWSFFIRWNYSIHHPLLKLVCLHPCERTGAHPSPFPAFPGRRWGNSISIHYNSSLTARSCIPCITSSIVSYFHSLHPLSQLIDGQLIHPLQVLIDGKQCEL